MTEKAKLTREQAEAIKRRRGNEEIAIEIQIERGWTHPGTKCLNDLTLDEFVRALYIGYEVEEKFKVGDWVNLHGHIMRVSEVTDNGVFLEGSDMAGLYGTNTNAYKSLKHATPEEIAKEKERRWWAKHGRGVWELKLNDEIRNKESDRRFDVVHIFDNGDINLERTSTNNYMQKEVMTVMKSYISNYYYEVICFAEDRKDVEQ